MPEFIEGTQRGRVVRIEITGHTGEMYHGRERALAKARALFVRLLTDAQRETFIHNEYIDVTAASGRRYRIWCAGSREGNIWLMAGAAMQGRFCVAPRGDIPRFDAFLGQLLLISTDEQKLFDVAEYSGYGRPWCDGAD